MPTTRATELAQMGSLVTANPSTSTVTVGGTLSATTLNPNNTGFRNRIINGDMRIDQRNAGAEVTTSGAWPVDRFQAANTTDGNFSAQQNPSASTGFIASLGFVASLKFTTTTEDSSLTTSQQASIFQAIEGTNVSDLGWGTANAKTVTLSFWVRSSLTGTFGGSLRNSANDRAYPFTYTISAADTWEQKSVTIAGDTSGTWLTNTGRGIGLAFSMGAGPDRSGTAGVWAGSFLTSATGAVSVIGTLNATWYITGVQLEVGSTATDFERRPIGTELALCQRYTYVISENNFFGTITLRTTGSNVYGVVPVTTSMRASPTSTGTITGYVGDTNATMTVTFTDNGSGLSLTGTSTTSLGSNGQCGILYATTKITLSAEL